MKLSLLTAALAFVPAAFAGNAKQNTKQRTMTSNKHTQARELNYTSVAGVFLQDDSATDASSFDYADWNLGLVNRTYPSDAKKVHGEWPKGYRTQWQRFGKYVEYLNHHAGKDTQYKVLVMGRHGEGYHNAAETYYGTPAWNCYWSLKTGNGTVTWEDALLTEAGEEQAYKANSFFRARFEEYGMPYFDSYYTSPLARCVITAKITFGDLDLPHSQRFYPTVKEYFRESISIHTCDHRSNKTYIHSLNPKSTFEKGFSDVDELWTGVEGETSDAQLARSKKVLDDVFTNDDGTWISVTSHSGEITKLLATLNHRTFKLSTGQIIPVLVKAQRVAVEATSTYAAWSTEATCNSPPVTSVSGSGCVCSSSTTLASTSATTTSN